MKAALISGSSSGIGRAISEKVLKVELGSLVWPETIVNSSQRKKIIPNEADLSKVKNFQN